jgi:hypothetical protein
LKNKHTTPITTLAFLSAVSLAAVLAFASCDNSFGVFQSIQTEKPQVGTSVFLNSTVRSVGEDATNYYAEMASIYYRPKSGGTWKLLSVNGSSDEVAAMATNSPNLYVALKNASTGVTSYIYKTSDSGVTWTSLGITGFGTKQLYAMYSLNGTLFAATHSLGTTPSYDLFYYNGTDFVSAGATVSSLASSIDGLVWDGTNYWVMTSSQLFKGTLGVFTEEKTTGTPSSSKTLTGIAVDSANAIVVTTYDGILYKYASSAWTSNTLDSGIKLGPILAVSGPSGEKRYAMGKHDTAYGYLEYNYTTNTLYGGDKGFLVPLASTYSTTSYGKPVIGFYLMSDNVTMFIAFSAQGTGTYSLYKNKFASNAWAGWTAE